MEQKSAKKKRIFDIIQIGINDWVKKTPSYHTVYNW